MRLARSTVSCISLVAALLSCDTAPSREVGGANAPPRLHVRGRALWYGDTIVLLRGLNVGDPFLARGGRPASDYSRIASEWKANAVRITVHPTVWRHTNRDSVRSRLTAEMSAATSAGLFVILTYHAIGWPDGYTFQHSYPDLAADAYDADFQLARTFWEAVPEWFGQDGRVAFDLWNEAIAEREVRALGNLVTAGAPPPRAATLDSLFSGALLLPPDSSWRELRPRWQELIDLVRRRSQNLVLVGGSVAAGSLRGVREHPIRDDNVAYSWHLYPVTDPHGDGRHWPVLLDGLAAHAPVILTEWGFDPTTPSTDGWTGTADSAYPRRLRERVLDAPGQHWIAWVWHPTWGPAMLQSDWEGTTPFGTYVKSLLAEQPALVRP